MSWDQWVVLLLGVPALGMTQIERLQKWACIPGALGQIGWFAGIKDDQPAFMIASVLCALIWAYSAWKHWLKPIWQGCSDPDTASIPTESPGIGRAWRKELGENWKPKPRLVRKDHSPKP